MTCAPFSRRAVGYCSILYRVNTLSGLHEKTQTYNLSLEASAHDLLAAVTSTRRASTTYMWSAKEEG